MAALVILGATSAAAQLIDYGFGIVWHLRDLYKKVKCVPQAHREFESQLNLLIYFAERIQNNSTLR